MTEIFLALVLILVGFASCVAGIDINSPIVREDTIKFCIEKPADCKKEYDFNKTKVEIEKLREGTK